MEFIVKGFLLILLLVLIHSQPYKQTNPNNRSNELKSDPNNKDELRQKGKPDQKQNNGTNQTEYKNDNTNEEKSNNSTTQQERGNGRNNSDKQPKDKNSSDCQCQNQGKCFTFQQSQEVYCNCNSVYIGKRCEQQAEQISNQEQLFKFINIYNYKYFYYEPKEQDMLSFTFHMCFESKNFQNQSQNKQLQNSVTFFLETQDENASLNLSEQDNNPITVAIKQNQCKYVTVDYTLFSLTKFKTYPKLVLALKLGQKINNIPKTTTKNPQSQISLFDQLNNARTLFSLEFQIKTVPNDKNLTSNYWTKGKKNITFAGEARKNLNPGQVRRIYLNFNAIPFKFDQVLETIVQSLITLTAFIIVGAMVFILRTRIFGVGITQSLSSNTGLTNDLDYFDIYIPSEQYIKQFDDQMRDHYHVAQMDQDCSICLGNIQSGQMIRKTPCDHVFHKLCLDSWCAQNLTCPMCRRSLTQAKMKQFYNSSSSELASNSDSND